MSVFNRFGNALASMGSAIGDKLFSRERSERQAHAEKMEALYLGTQYEASKLAPSWPNLPVGDRTPLRLQKPAVQYDLPELLVNRPTSLLFGEGRAPKVTLQAHDGADTTEVNAWLATIVADAELWFRMLIASRLVAITGACAVTWCVCAGESDEGGAFEFEAHRSSDCIPEFDPKKHNRLVRLEKRYRYDREVEKVVDGARRKIVEKWWHREEWTTAQHIVYADAPVSPDGKEPTWTVADAVEHGFGFVPAHWVRLEDGLCRDAGGVSHLRGISDVTESIDRTLGQKDRAVFYNQDPERHVFGVPVEQRAAFLGGAGVRFLPPKKEGVETSIVEYNGEGQRVAEEHVQAQRNRVLEVKRVTSHDPDKVLAAARSGAALEVLNRPMVELVGEWRVPFGACVRAILGQILRAIRSGAMARLGVLETPAPAVIPQGRVMLTWGRAFPLTLEDLKVAVETAASMVDAGLCDRETAVRWVATQFGFDDVEEILERLEEELGQRSKRAQQMAATIGGTLPPEEDDAESDDTEGDTELKKTAEEDGKPSADKPDGEQTDTKPVLMHRSPHP